MTRLLAFVFFSLFSFNNNETEAGFPTLKIQKEGDISFNQKENAIVRYLDDALDTDLMIGALKRRGGLSRSFDKPSYSLELEKKIQFTDGFRRDDDWILNSSYIDKTFMRHRICYELFRQMNPNNISSKSHYLKLEINKESQGLYILMEEVNARMIGLKKKDSMAMLFKAPPIFYADSLAEDELVKKKNYYDQKYPKFKNQDMTVHIEALKDFLFHSSEEDFKKSITQWVDLENIMDWHLLLLFSNNGDGVMKNFYLYKEDAFTPYKIAIWDCDHTFGRDSDNEFNMMDRPVEPERAVLIRRLMELPPFLYRTKLKNRWLELRESSVFSYENMDRMIKDNNAIIGEQVKENFEIWKVDGAFYKDSNTYSQELEIIRAFTKLRLEELDKYFEQI